MKFTPILRGTEIVMPSSETDGTRGGFVRHLAPTDGFSWETKTDSGFISELALADHLLDLKLLRRRGRRTPAKFVGRGLVP